MAVSFVGSQGDTLIDGLLRYAVFAAVLRPVTVQVLFAVQMLFGPDISTETVFSPACAVIVALDAVAINIWPFCFQLNDQFVLSSPDWTRALNDSPVARLVGLQLRVRSAGGFEVGGAGSGGGGGGS